MRIIICYLVILLLQFSSLSGSRHGSFCNADTACDENQRCISNLCRCDPDERRFWTGEKCIICAQGYSFTNTRCYKTFELLKTWEAARIHCRAQYADLFTWRNNDDEQFIKPVTQRLSIAPALVKLWQTFFSLGIKNQYLAWAGASITSTNPHTTKWIDPEGIRLSETSHQWCDATRHVGYNAQKQPTSDTKTLSNGTVERKECVTYIFGPQGSDLLCLADDYCSQQYPFVCEMNTASMELAIASFHGTDNQNPSPESSVVIDFEQPPPPPPVSDDRLNGNPSAMEKGNQFFSNTNLMFVAAAGILVVGAIAGFIVFKKRRDAANSRRIPGQPSASQGRPSFASSIGSVMEG